MDKTVLILVVDDSSIVRSLIMKSLSQMGFDNYIESDNGYDAIAKIKDAYSAGKSFDVVFIDWSMPVMKGIDVVKKCKASEELKNIQFIMVSANHDMDSVMAALDAGVSDYLAKPFSTTDLESKFQRVLKSAKAA